jgi:ketosteroid isomerase-like protein
LTADNRLTPQGVTVTATPAQLVTRMMDAFVGRNGETLDKLFSADVRYWVAGSLPFSGRHEGRDHVVGEFLPGVIAHFVDGVPIETEVTSVVADGTRAAFEINAHGTLKNGNDYLNKYSFVIEVSDGEITEVREYADTQYIEHTIFAAATSSVQ